MSYPHTSRIAVVAVLAATLLLLPATVTAQIWGTYQGNASHTGFVPITIHPRGIQHVWTRTFAGQLNPVAIGSGRIYASEGGPSAFGFIAGRGLWAMNAHTGSTVWNYPDFGAVSSVNAPAFGNGTVYIQTGRGGFTPIEPYLYAFDAALGTPKFRVPYAAQWERHLAPTVYLGDAYVNGGYYGGAYRFDGVDGTARWATGLPQYDGWTPAVDDAYVYAYVGESSPGLYVLDRHTGAQAFMIPDPNFQWNGWTMNVAPVLTADGDVIATHGGRLVRFDVQGRRIEWERARNFTGQATLAGNVIYANDGGTLTAWDAVQGTLLWSWFGPGGETITGNLVATTTHVFVQSATTTYAVNLATRQAEWSYAAAGSLALGEGTLAITDDTVLHVFSVTVDPTIPQPPSGLTVTTIAGNQVTVRFTPPTVGAVPERYLLEGGVIPGQTLAVLPLGLAPEQTFSAPSGVFYVRVRSMAGGSASAVSNEIRIVVQQPEAPSAPVSLTGHGSGTNLRLTWKNTFTGGAVDGIVLDVTGAMATSLVLDAAETFTFDQVPPGTYTFAVRARNGAGTSAPSASVSLTFPAVCSGPPDTPAAFIAYRVGNVVRLSWDPPATGTAPAGYVVSVSGAFIGSFSTRARTLGGPLGPGSYGLSVTAVNTCGTSVATPVQTVVVP